MSKALTKDTSTRKTHANTGKVVCGVMVRRMRQRQTRARENKAASKNTSKVRQKCVKIKDVKAQMTNQTVFIRAILSSDRKCNRPSTASESTCRM